MGKPHLYKKREQLLSRDVNRTNDQSFRNRAFAATLDPWPCLATNNTGGDLDRYSIVALQAPAILPSENSAEFRQRIHFKGITPLAAYPATGKFGITQIPLANGATGPVIIDGLATCTVNVTAATHNFADVTAGDCTKLTSANSGPAYIVWPGGVTGSQTCIVRLGAPTARGVCTLFAPKTYFTVSGSDGSQVLVTTAVPQTMVFQESIGDVSPMGIVNLASAATGLSSNALQFTRGGFYSVRLYLWLEPGGSWVASGSGGTNGDTGTPRKQTYTTTSAGTPSHAHDVTSRVLMDPAIYARITASVSAVNVGPQIQQQIPYLNANAASNINWIPIVGEFTFNALALTTMRFDVQALNPSSIGGNPGFKVPLDTNGRIVIERISNIVPQTAFP